MRQQERALNVVGYLRVWRIVMNQELGGLAKVYQWDWQWIVHMRGRSIMSWYLEDVRCIIKLNSVQGCESIHLGWHEWHLGCWNEWWSVCCGVLVKWHVGGLIWLLWTQPNWYCNCLTSILFPAVLHPNDCRRQFLCPNRWRHQPRIQLGMEVGGVKGWNHRCLFWAAHATMQCHWVQHWVEFFVWSWSECHWRTLRNGRLMGGMNGHPEWLASSVLGCQG